MRKFAKHVTPIVIESMDLSFTKTIFGLSRIMSMTVPHDFTESVHMLDSLDATRNSLEKLVEEEFNDGEKDFLVKTVRVSFLDLKWLFAGHKNFTAASTILSKMPVRFFNSKFCVTILDYFWNDVMWMLFWR